MRVVAVLCTLLGSSILRSFCEPLPYSPSAAWEEDEYVELSDADIEDVERAYRRFREQAKLHRSDDDAEKTIAVAGLGAFKQPCNREHLQPPSAQIADPAFLVYSNAYDERPWDESKREPVLTLRHDENFNAVAKHVDPGQTFYFIVHGFLAKGNVQWVHRIKDDILAVEKATVIVVKWAQRISSINYTVAACGTRTVARLAATMVKTLVDAGVLVPSRIHYIGHSLGAQAGGFFGEDVLEMTGSQVGRITGLDPASPLFEYFDVYLRKEHAHFVDIIHTSIDRFMKVAPFTLGVTTQSGHVDFYPSGGRKQPGCKIPGCSHSRAHLYYANSIRTCSYPTLRCDSYEDFKRNHCKPCDETSCGVMGHRASVKLRGKHFLSISSAPPHCPGGAVARTASLVVLISSLLSVAVSFTAILDDNQRITNRLL